MSRERERERERDQERERERENEKENREISRIYFYHYTIELLSVYIAAELIDSLKRMITQSEKG